MDWLGGPSQHARLIEIDTSLPDALAVERFHGREAVSELFQFSVDCLCPSVGLDLNVLLGEPMSLRLRLADGGQRVWHGLVTQAAQLGTDGGLARYRLSLEPWPALLRLRRNNLIFQDLDVLGILDRIFADFPQANYRSEVTQPLRTRPICTQYRESDWAFVSRLLAEDGLSYRFEHHDNAGGLEAIAGRTAAQAQHTMVLFDRDAALPTGTQPTVRFHRIAATESDDTIAAFSRQHQAAPTAVTSASWHAGAVQTVAAMAAAPDVVSALPELEVFDAARSGRWNDSQGARADLADRSAQQQLDGLRLPAQLHTGIGAVRALAPGTAVTLLGGPDAEVFAFVPLVIEHQAANNLGSQVARLLAASDIETGSYRNQFLAVPLGIPLVPHQLLRATAPGPQTARVVGVADSTLTSNRDHQVRVQFSWQRGPAPASGGLTDAVSRTHPAGHAPGNESSGTWVRLAEPLAGPNWGSSFVPRIGSEVLIDFVQGDLDQPVIVGQLYNGEHAPPFAAGIDANANHPGTLSGIQTQGVDGQGGHRWVLDDASGQLRHRLDTTLADASLSLGYLIDQSGAQRGAYRGLGAELATQGWGMLRAGAGLLLSTRAQPQAISTQLTVTEAVGQLQAAVATAQALSDAAEHATARPLATIADASQFLTAIDPAQDGHHAGAVNGQTSTQPTAEARDGGDPVARFASPLMLMESPASLAWTTPATAAVFAGESMHMTTQSDAHIVAGATASLVSGRASSVFAHAGPIQVIAEHGPVSVQAHTDTLELLADQSVTVTATATRIDVLAKEKIVLQQGPVTVTLQGGDITLACPGTFTVKASQHPFTSGESDAAVLPELPAGEVTIDGTYPFSV